MCLLRKVEAYGRLFFWVQKMAKEQNLVTCYLKKDRRKRPKNSLYEVGDPVKIVKITPKKRRYLKFYGYNPVGKKGVVTAILGTKQNPCQGVRIKFPWMWIKGKNGGKKIWGFESPFYIEEVQKISEVELQEQEGIRYRKGEALKSAVKKVKRLRKEGRSILEIAKIFGVSERTVFRWLKKCPDI